MMDPVYIGGDREVFAEAHVFTGWHEIVEWLESVNTYDIESIRIFHGPGSLLMCLVTFVRTTKEGS